MGEEMPKEDFIREYMVIRAKKFKESTIKSAWKSSGAWPVNPDIFTDQDYAPSIPFFTQTVDLPSSFPINTFQSINIIRSTLVMPEAPDTISPPTFYTTPSRPTPTSSPSTPMSTLCPSSLRRTRSTSDDPDDPNTAKHRRANDTLTWDYIRHLEGENAQLRAHCAIAGHEIMGLKRKINTRAAKKNGKAKLNVEARTQTSHKGLQLARDRENLTQEKEADKKRGDDERQAKEKEDQRLCEAQASMLSSKAPWQARTKPNSRTLNEALRNHPHYAGIFNRSRAPVSNDPPAESPLADISNINSTPIAGPSNFPNFHANFYPRVANQSVAYTPSPTP
ncbi:hypothetical protein K438DRAFT_1960169 [Mycena galopus ATCC 62051]|nr:hypothetical protein K438DRAFT_1960169 [Mycena galopus ATCC 62051]